MQMRTLTATEWQPVAAVHAATVDRLTAEHRQRRARGAKHPVEDFIWDYYFLRPSGLRTWHPGVGLALAEAGEYTGRRGYRVDAVGVAEIDPDWVARQTPQWRQIRELLAATAERAPRIGCHGLHEWAMVYRATPTEIRHESTPLRLSAAEIAEVVEGQGLRCTHYDAYRFFTPAAAVRNARPLSRELQVHTEQPGCLHANMDLYKWCYKLTPAVSSELTMRIFSLARQIRKLDMQAAPYDLSGYGLAPVRIETTAGRAEFDQRQAEFASQAAALRAELIEVIDQALAVRTPATA